MAPQILLLLAGFAAVIGFRRLPVASTQSPHRTKHALLAWFLLLTGGVVVWLLGASHHL